MNIIPKLSCALEKKLWEQVLNYHKQDKTAYLSVALLFAISDKLKVRKFCLI